MKSRRIGAPELDTNQSMMAYPNGMDEVEPQLDKINIVQPYSEVVDLEPDGHRSNFRELCSTGRDPVSLINGVIVWVGDQGNSYVL